MSAKLQLVDHPATEKQDLAQFQHDVLKGLSKPRKSLSSKYFYDDKGSQLFKEITEHPDYYLTSCEYEIIDQNKNELSALFDKKNFNLIELGPGEGIKTRCLLDKLLADKRQFTYFTIDISNKFLKYIIKKFNEELPDLSLIALNSDYFQGLKWLSLHSQKPNLVLFLGSSIGNFDPMNTHIFLRKLHNDLHISDYLFIGFDLRKNIKIITQAYNDSAGITRQFNLNLLERINRDLGGNFFYDQFDHYAPYNPQSGAMESYLISLQSQEVFINSLNRRFHFDAYEPIHVEYSYKYLLTEIENYAMKNGFKIIKNFFDSKGYFVNSLWQVI